LPSLRGLLDRPRLRFGGADESSLLTVVQAPSGFGKSVLLRQWARARPATERGVLASVPNRPAADHEQWWSAVYERAGALVESRSAPAPGDARAAVERLVLSASEPLTLMVDDADPTDPDRAGALLDLLEQTDNLRLVLATRALGGGGDTAGLRLAALGGAVITGAQLCFTYAEVGALGRMMGVPDDVLDVGRIEQATSGWPAATVAVLTELARSGSWQNAINGAVAIIAQAVVGSAGAGEPAMTLSLPDRLTPELDAELTGDPLAADRLREWAAAGLLVVDAAADPAGYRWADAVRAALQCQFERSDGGASVRSAHSRVARWFARHDDAALALRHATRARQWPLAVEVVEKHARSLMISQPLEVRATVVEIPLEDAATSTTVLALRDLWLRVPDNLLLSAARLPTAAGDLAALGAADGGRRTLEAGLWVIAALRIRGWIREAGDYARRLLLVLAAARSAHPAKVAEIYPTLQLHAGIALLLGGDFTAALSCLREAHLWAADNPNQYIASDASSKTALAHAAMGDQRRAAAWLDRHDAAPLDAPYYARYIRCTTATARLLLAVDQLDPDTAEAAYAEQLALDAHNELFWGYVTYSQAQYALMVGAAADMLDALRRARVQHRGELDHGAVAGRLLAAAEADLLIALRRGNEAEVVINGEHAGDPMLRVSQARLALLTGDDQAALRLATDSNWDRAAVPRSRLEMLLIQSIAARRTGDRANAERALGRAVAAARMTGLRRPFRSVPAEELAQLASSLPDAQSLLLEPALRHQAEMFAGPVSLVRLTGRERQLLDKLASDLTRQQIANSMRVSFNTVKVQLRGLYRKLEVESRADAIARGREYGLLP
jgi:LuxR family maltose regulon positive regulatory protein